MTSTYTLAMSNLHDKQVVIESSEWRSKSLWTLTWSLMVPPKVKHFCFWRLCHNLLHFKANLVHRRISNDVVYPRCGLDSKSDFDICFSCKYAKSV